MTLAALLADVLFVGHSLIGPSLPALVERAAAAQGTELRAEAQIINGAPLKWNWHNAADAEGEDGRQRLASGQVEHLVLTEAMPLQNHLQWSESFDYARHWAGLAQGANPDTQVWVYETWHSLDSGSGIKIEGDAGADTPWRARIDQDWPAWQSLAAAAGPDTKIIPAGQAMGLLADEIAKGTVPGLSDIRDVFRDDIHPNDRGLYLIAMVTYASLSSKNPQGLPARLTRQWASRSTVVTAPMAERLQEIAWQTVETWRDAPLPATTTTTTEPPQTQAHPMPPATAPLAVVDIPALGGVTADGIGFGLAGINDWSVQQPFLDVMKTARPWVLHTSGQWGGGDHDDLASGGWLDANGWPMALPPKASGVSTLVLTDLPANAQGVEGRYVLSYEGRGKLKLDGRARPVQQAPKRIIFDYSPGQGGVVITLSDLHPEDPLRDIKIFREDREALLAQGQIFNPDWLARIQGTKLVRFMDWMNTNFATLARVQDRPKPSDYTYARHGAPIEVMIALANHLNADPWFTLPHLGDDDLVRFYAQTTKDQLDPALKAYVEYSNEVWNHIFPQSQWAEAQAQKRWRQDWKWVQFYALRASEVATIWGEVYADAPAQLVRVLATQTGWKGLETDILEAPLVQSEGRPAPWKSFDAWAVTGYFGGQLGTDDTSDLVLGWIEESRLVENADPKRRRFDLALSRAAEELQDGRHSGKLGDSLQGLLGDLLPYHAAIAKRHDLDLVMYEGGTHAVGHGMLQNDALVTEFLTTLNYAPEMGALYRQLVDGWQSLSAAPFNAFVDVYAPNRYGSWGSLRHLGDDNPRWRALARGE